MYKKHSYPQLPHLRSRRNDQYFQTLFQDQSLYQAPSDITIQAPNWDSLAQLTHAPLSLDMDHYFIRCAYFIKHPIIRSHHIQASNKIYTLIQQRLRELSVVPQTLEEIFTGPWLAQIDDILLQMHRFFERDRSIIELQDKCQATFQELASQLQTHFHIQIPPQNWQAPQYTHIQDIMINIETLTKDFLTNLNHPSLRSLSDLLELQPIQQPIQQPPQLLPTLSPSQVHSLIDHQTLYQKYATLRQDFLLLMQVLIDRHSSETINYGYKDLPQKPFEEFMHHQLCPYMLSFMSKSPQSQADTNPGPVQFHTEKISEQIQFKLLNQASDSTTITK